MQAAALGEGVKDGHVGRQAPIVDRHEGLGARRDGRLDCSGIDVEGGGVDVDQLHIRAKVAHHLGGGGEGVGGGDDFIAGPDAQGLQGQVQTRRGRVHGHAMQVGIAQEVGEGQLEPPCLGAGGDPATAQGFHHFGDLILTDIRQGKGHEGLHDRCCCVRLGAQRNGRR
jgi:hypothetical protein